VFESPHDAGLGCFWPAGVSVLAATSASMKDLLKWKSFLMTSSVIARALVTCSPDCAYWDWGIGGFSLSTELGIPEVTPRGLGTYLPLSEADHVGGQ
jgi:hypothetical protein